MQLCPQLWLSYDRDGAHNSFVRALPDCVCSYYTLHVLWVVVPGTHAPFLLQLWMHLLFAFPALAVMIFMSPMVAKYQCLLTNVLYRDDGDCEAPQFRAFHRMPLALSCLSLSFCLVPKMSSDCSLRLHVRRAHRRDCREAAEGDFDAE